MSEQQKHTVVEAGTELCGTLTSTCPVDVHGKIDGEFRAPALNVSEAGAVFGNITVKQLRSDGVISGNIDADDVHLAGRVAPSTTLKAKTLEVRLRSAAGSKLEVMFGECVLEVGDEPELESPKDAFQDALDNEAPPPATLLADTSLAEPSAVSLGEEEFTGARPSTPPR